VLSQLLQYHLSSLLNFIEPVVESDDAFTTEVATARNAFHQGTSSDHTSGLIHADLPRKTCQTEISATSGESSHEGIENDRKT